ncbi:MAG: hypothetical protein N3B21_13095 [Clostridia bacterium]|nr:hypothetical protein [Clostridia bacterium]
MLKKIEAILQNKLAPFCLIAILALIVYCNSFTSPFTLDDFGSISNNYSIRNPLDIASMWQFYSGRVLAYITFSINYFIHDTGVIGYHIVNTLIHIINGILVYLILHSILGLEHFKGKIPGKYKSLISLLCAFIFICHPVQVNAVTYIVQRIASLAAMFYLLAVLFFLKYRIHDKWIYLVFTLIFTVMAMFTKENSITIPFMLLILELMFFLKDGKTSWKKRGAFLFILLATICIVPGTLLLLKGYSQSDPSVSFKASTSMDRFHYFFTELNVIVIYIKLLFLPYNQNFDYSNDFPVSTTIWENYSYISFIILCLIGLFGLLNLKRNKLITLGILWFFIGLSVESSFISIKDVYFEHRLYFPIIGFIMFIVGLSFMEFKNPHRRYLFQKPLLIFMVITCTMILSYSTLTLKRNYIFSNDIRLWSDVVKKAPKSDRAHSILGKNYLDAAELYEDKRKDYLEQAEKELHEAIKLDYHNDTAHCNLAKVYLMKKDYENCIIQANVANSMERSVYAYNNLGLAYKEMGKQKDAIGAFQEGYNIDNKCTFITKNLADTYYEIKDYKNAKSYYEQYQKNALRKNSDVQKKLEDINGKLK